MIDPVFSCVFQRTPSSTHSQVRVWNGVLETRKGSEHRWPERSICSSSGFLFRLIVYITTRSFSNTNSDSQFGAWNRSSQASVVTLAVQDVEI
jgi:hypothetical protein